MDAVILKHSEESGLKQVLQFAGSPETAHPPRPAESSVPPDCPFSLLLMFCLLCLVTLAA